MRQLKYLLFFILFPLAPHAATVTKTLYLNRGQFLAVDSTTFPALAFNDSAVYRKESSRILLSPGDSLSITLINADTAAHSFFAEGFMVSGMSVPAGDTVSGTFHFPAAGLFLYWDDIHFPVNRYLGAVGMIVVEAPNTFGKFYWDIREFQSAWNQTLATGGTVNWASYKPTYFTVNGNGKPGILLDTDAMITGHVGDTIQIYMVNTGLGLHSIHFHGFHSEILYASEDPLYVGRVKDTFPLESMQRMIIRMIPDKTGKYPVHDHNLIAVTGGGYYKNGIFLYSDIQ